MNKAILYLFKPEEQLILILSQLSIDKDELHMANECIASMVEMEWLKFYDLAIKHKVCNLVYQNAKKYSIPIFGNKAWSKLFNNNKNVNELRNRFLYQEFIPILKNLEADGIRYAALKGLHLNHAVYFDLSLRHSNDLDLLVEESSLSLITQRLIDNGYVQSLDAGSMEPASTKLKKFYRLSTHELVPFLKRTDNPFCPVINIDVQFDIIGRSKYMRKVLPYNIVFDSVQCVSFLPPESTDIQVLSDEFALVQLCAHLFRDMTRIQDILTGRDLKLIQFLDIYSFIETQNINWILLLDYCHTYDLSEILYYVLHHVNFIYQTSTPEWFIEKIKPTEEAFVLRYGFEEVGAYYWKIPFNERLFGNKHREELKGLDTSLFTESIKFSDGVASFRS